METLVAAIISGIAASVTQEIIKFLSNKFKKLALARRRRKLLLL